MSGFLPLCENGKARLVRLSRKIRQKPVKAQLVLPERHQQLPQSHIPLRPQLLNSRLSGTRRPVPDPRLELSRRLREL